MVIPFVAANLLITNLNKKGRIVICLRYASDSVSSIRNSKKCQFLLPKITILLSDYLIPNDKSRL